MPTIENFTTLKNAIKSRIEILTCTLDHESYALKNSSRAVTCHADRMPHCQ